MSQELETPCGSCQGYWSIRYEKVDVDVDIDDTEPSHGCLAGDGPEAARPPFLPPIREVPKPRRRAIWVWICCRCCHGGMKVTIDPCPYCGISRCPNCPTHQVNVRPAHGVPDIQNEVSFED